MLDSILSQKHLNVITTIPSHEINGQSSPIFWQIFLTWRDLFSLMRGNPDDKTM